TPTSSPNSEPAGPGTGPAATTHGGSVPAGTDPPCCVCAASAGRSALERSATVGELALEDVALGEDLEHRVDHGMRDGTGPESAEHRPDPERQQPHHPQIGRASCRETGRM